MPNCVISGKNWISLFLQNIFKEDQHPQACTENYILGEIARHFDWGYRDAAKEALRVRVLPPFYVCE